MATKHPDLFTPDEAADLSRATHGRRRGQTVANVGSRVQTCGAEFRPETMLRLDSMTKPDIDNLQRENNRLSAQLDEAAAVITDLRRKASTADMAWRLSDQHRAKLGGVRKTNRTLNARLAKGHVVHAVPDALASMSGNVCQFACLLTAPPCVYFLIDRGQVVYVGQTTNLLQRIADHYAGGEGKSFDEVYFVPVKIQELCQVEAAFIARLAPRLNESRPFVPHESVALICSRFEGGSK